MLGHGGLQCSRFADSHFGRSAPEWFFNVASQYYILGVHTICLETWKGKISFFILSEHLYLHLLLRSSLAWIQYMGLAQSCLLLPKNKEWIGNCGKAALHRQRNVQLAEKRVHHQFVWTKTINYQRAFSKCRALRRNVCCMIKMCSYVIIRFITNHVHKCDNVQKQALRLYFLWAM